MRNVLEYLIATAERLPEHLAFADEKQSFTFRETVEFVRDLGETVYRQTGARNRPIGVVVRRNAVSLLGCFAALWAGCYYVPLDAAMPVDRLTGILDKLDPAAILCTEQDKKLTETLSAYAPLFRMDEPHPVEHVTEPWRAVLDVDPCYMIFTSGSTGVPKGILIAHRSLIDFTEWYTELTGVTEEDRLGNQAPFFFDTSVRDFSLTLKAGATAYILPKKLFSFPVLLIKELEEKRITTLCWSAAAFNLTANSGVFEKYQPHYVKRVLVGGEVLQPKLLNVWRRAVPDAKYYNLYGPTEITVDCTCYPIDREFADDENIPIGRACTNMEMLIFDEDDRPCGVGEMGELCVRGTGLAIGYFHEPEKTAAAFVQNPLCPNYPDRMYRTGDLGWFDEEGLIHFAGRKDTQVKHNGYRIELGEIETALNALPEIKEAVCFFDAEADRIIAVYTGDVDAAGIVHGLRDRLPKYMVPEYFRRVEEMPRLPNGKTDRVKLRRENL